MDGSSPQSIGKYRIETIVGRGAMGVVYKAVDPEIGRYVAIKTLRINRSHNLDTLLERFKQEARSAGRLRHPNIVTVFEVDKEGDYPYMVMEYVDGEGLNLKITKHKRLSPKYAIGILKQLAEAIDYAHKLGVIHRDIKPSNILIDNNNQPYILDFGVATFGYGPANTGVVLGSPGYMSPEQIQNKELDKRSDLFSLAIVAFECFTGRRPFPGDDSNTVVQNIVNSKPLSLTELIPDLPLTLEAEFEKALSKDRERRFGSAVEMVGAFAKTLSIDLATLTIKADEAVSIAGQGENNQQSSEDQSLEQSVGWKRVRQRKFSDFASTAPVDQRLPEVIKKAEKPSDDFARPKAAGDGRDLLRNAKGLRPGESLFTPPRKSSRSEDQPKAILVSGRVMMIGFIVITLSITPILVKKYLQKPTPAEAVEAIQTIEQPLEVDPAESFNIPQVDPVPADKLVADMTDKELLGVLISKGIGDDLILDALKLGVARRVPQFIEAAVFALESDSYLVRIEAIKSMAAYGDKRIVPYLMPLLNDHDSEVRRSAALALGRLGDRRAVGYLSNRRLTEEDTGVRQAIKDAIDAINGFPS